MIIGVVGQHNYVFSDETLLSVICKNNNSFFNV